MRLFLQFGLMCYLLSIGAEAFLSYHCVRRKVLTSFTLYTCYFTAQGAILFTLLFLHDYLDNGGLYVKAYWVSEYIQDVLLAWVVIDLLWRKLREPGDKLLLSGIAVAVIFPNLIHYRESAPYWVMFVPTFAFLLAQALWWKGIKEVVPQ